jgi:hypothetical protein
MLGIGVGLTYGQGYADTIRSISETLPLDWLSTSAHSDWVVLVWFVSICAVAAVLLLNVVACIWLYMARLLKNTGGLQRWLFILTHIMFAVVLLCHGMGMVFGFKYSGIEMWHKDVYSFEAGYEIALDEITFDDDVKMLEADYKNRRSMMTRERFHPAKNSGAVTLTYKGRVIQSGKIHILSPMVADGIRITMTDFIYDKDKTENPIGISLVVTKNPVTPLFFTSYVALILSLIWYVIATWNPRSMGRLLRKVS